MLHLSYSSANELNRIIDENLPSRPHFECLEVVVAGEVFDVYFRDILHCVRSLYGNPEFLSLLIFAPERHYVDSDQTNRLYHDMHTGKWWWETQVSHFRFNKSFSQRRLIEIYYLLESSRGQTSRRNHCPHYHVFGQNPAHPFP